MTFNRFTPPPSFRDAQSLQPILNALDQRLAIADKYAGIQPVFAICARLRGPGVMRPIARSGNSWPVVSTTPRPKNLTAGNSVSVTGTQVGAQRHRSVQILACPPGFLHLYNSGNITFKSSVNFAVFKLKLNSSRESHSQFLQAHPPPPARRIAFLAQAGPQRPTSGSRIQNSLVYSADGSVARRNPPHRLAGKYPRSLVDVLRIRSAIICKVSPGRISDRFARLHPRLR